jgi:hypothetical protein
LTLFNNFEIIDTGWLISPFSNRFVSLESPWSTVLASRRRTGK